MNDAPESDSSTREQILHLVVERGPVSVLDLAKDLGLTPAGVRRHIAAMEEAGEIAVHTSARGTSPTRGRPARRYVATGRAQASLDCSYAELAEQVMDYLVQVAGTEAADGFAEQRATQIEESVRSTVSGGADVVRRVHLLAESLAPAGYAASVREVPGGRAVQLCQGHCPVQDVAARYPALCEAETRMFSRLLGVHVQRLSTLVSGAHVCTTHVPIGVVGTAPVEAPDNPHDLNRPTAARRRRAATLEGNR